MTFVGIAADTINMRLTLTHDRLLELKTEINAWLSKLCASKRDLQSLVGKLNFASGTVRSGRLFFSRILTLMKSFPDRGVRHLSAEAKMDIKWVEDIHRTV